MLPTYRCIKMLNCLFLFFFLFFLFFFFAIMVISLFYLLVCNIAHAASLQGSYILVFCPYLTVKTHVLILDGCYLVILFFDRLLLSTPQVMYQLFSQLLSRMWKHHITAALPEVFCFRLLTRKQQLIHLFLTDVHIIILQIPQFSFDTHEQSFPYYKDV